MANSVTDQGRRYRGVAGNRRGGFMGGVILILLGVLLLAHNFRPEIPAWEILSRWWPVLLILLGVGRMIENIIARNTGRPPGRLLNGGEVFLILLVLGAAGVITFAHRNPGAGINWLDDVNPPWGEHAEETQELPPKPVKPGAEILIQVQRGDVTVSGTDEAEIRVVAKKSATAFDADSARQRARTSSVKLVETSRGYEVSPETPGGSERVRTDLEIQVPKDTVVNVKTEHGNVRICDIKGNVEASTVRGSIEVCNSGGDVRADIKHGDARILTAKGNVRLTGSGSEVEIDDVSGDASVDGEFYGPIRARNVAKGTHFVSARTDLTLGPLPGKMEMDSGDLSVDDASGNIQLTTREKDVVMENVSGRLRIENKRGEVKVRLLQAPKQDISISNESGGVELALPANSSFEVDATSRSGEIQNDFDDPDLKATDDGHGNGALHGKRGSKGPRVELHSTYGQIRLRKSD